ncbi:unnamed protein product [Leptidea sinapis]|uniref:Phosphatidic acid phosphatase type 2/haloperoxidase domain-containing protein n=1 Tax=Leptidea sinapis TaxID=189913 RepID=A0A5E4QI23_9NEOP|nr:unnamed protein product [Leptidea sinapis]
MCLTEWIRLRDFKGGRSRVLLGKEVPAWLWEVYRVVGVFLFGCACQQLTTDIAKCTSNRKVENKGDREVEMIKSLIMFTSLKWKLALMQNIIVTCAKNMYLQKRFVWRGSKLLRHGIQFTMLMMAWYTVMSRVSDYKHHWSDFLFVSDLRKTPRRQTGAHDNELTTNGNTRSAPAWQV